MAKKKARRASAQSATKSSKKVTKKSGKRAATSGGKAKAATKVSKLPAAKLAVLKKVVAKGDWHSKAAIDLDHALFDAVFKDLGTDFERLRELPPVRAGYWAGFCFEGEVNNGGFHQFFFNNGPVPGAVALEFFTKHGPKDVAKLLEAAIKKLPKGRLPKDAEAMVDVLCPDDMDEDERLVREMDKVTDKFFDRKGPALRQERLKLALANAGEFFV